MTLELMGIQWHLIGNERCNGSGEISMYCICEDLSKRRQPFYTIDASHKWGLPGVECPRCGKWTGIGNAYPHVELSTLPNERWYRTGRNVSVAEYMKCVEQVEVLLPEGAFLEPGTKFGPLEGDARGTFNDVSWMSPWILIMRRDAVEKLAKDVKPDLISVPLELSYRGKGPCDLVEVFVEARSRVSDSYTPG